MKIEFRDADDNDYWFAFELKKAAEYEAIKAVFGWDEDVQKEIHSEEWTHGKPTLICLTGDPVGSFMLESNNDYMHFCRFFLLPEYHGKGIGSSVLERVIEQLDQQQTICKLSYLQGNRVGRLYERFGFKIIEQNNHFVYMSREPICFNKATS